MSERHGVAEPLPETLGAGEFHLPVLLSAPRGAVTPAHDPMRERQPTSRSSMDWEPLSSAARAVVGRPSAWRSSRVAPRRDAGLSPQDARTSAATNKGGSHSPG